MVDQIARLGIQIDSRTVKTAEKSLDGFSASSKRAERASEQFRGAQSKASRASDKFRASNDNTRKSLDKTSKSMRGVAAAAALIISSLGLRQLAQYADAWTKVNNQLKQVTNSEMELAKVTQNVFDIAQRTRSEVGATAELYQRLSIASSELGLSQERLGKLTETINKSFTLSGATAAEAAGAVRQLAQGLAAGALRGDEFNSVAEQAPIIMRAIAKETGLTIGELREFAATGGITAEIVVSALEKAGKGIDDAFGKSIPTIGQSFIQLQNVITRSVGQFNDAFGIGGSVSNAILSFANLIEEATKETIQFLTEIRKIGSVSVTVSKTFLAIWKTTLTIWGGLWSTAGEIIKGVFAIITDPQNAPANFVNTWERVLEEVSEGFIEIERIWAEATNVMEEDARKVGGGIIQVVEDGKSQFDKLVDHLRSVFPDVGKSIEDNLTSAFQNTIETGEDFFGNFFNTLKSMAAQAAAEIARLLVFRPIIEGATGVLSGGGASVAGTGSSLLGIGSSALSGVSALFSEGGSILANTFVDTMFELGNPLGAVFENAIADGLAASPYGALGSLAASLLGLGGGIGGSVGGGVGSIAGGAIGGPIGAAIGGFLGSAVGGLFGGGAPTNAASAEAIIGTGGTFRDFATGQTGKGDSASARDFLNQVVQPILTTLEQAGIDLVGNVGLSVLEGVPTLFTRINGEIADQFQFDPEDASSVQSAVDGLVRTLVDGAESITDAEIAAKLAAGELGNTAEEIFATIAKIQARPAFIQSIEDAILQLTDPSSFALEQVTREFDALRAAAEELEIPLDRINELERLRIEQLQNGATSLESVTDTAFNALQRSIQAEKERLAGEYQTEVDRINGQIATVQSASRALDGLLNSLESTVNSLQLNTLEARRSSRISAQSALRAALSTARAGGSLEEVDLTNELRAIQRPSEDLFASFEEYQRDFYLTKNLVGDLASETSAQLTTEQKMLDTLNSQLVTAQTAYEAQIASLDSQLEFYQEQIDLLRGIDNSLKSLNVAQTNLNTALTNESMGSGAAPVGAIERAYQDILGRSAEAEGLAFWSGLLESGTLSIAEIRNQIASSPEALGLPGFANGGVFAGGLRMVGERGPELEFTGPSRIMSNSDMMNALDNKQVVDAILSMKDEVKQVLFSIARNTYESADTLDTWDVNGLPPERV